MTGWWLALAALAAEPPEVTHQGDTGMSTYVEDGEVVHEIIVHGDLEVERARRELIRSLRSEGYTDLEDRGDYLLLRHPEPWKGEIRIHDDGWVRMKRQPVRVVAPEMPWAEQGSPLAWAGCVIYPWLCLRPGGALVGKRKFTGQKVRTLGSIEEDASVLADRVADRNTEQTVNELPERLETLWNEGVPLQGEGHLATHAERRRAILEFWDSRTDTVWGDRVRLAVEAFLRAEVQSSEHALSEAEVAAFNAQRSCTRPLDLRSPWAEVTATVDTTW